MIPGPVCKRRLRTGATFTFTAATRNTRRPRTVSAHGRFNVDLRQNQRRIRAVNTPSCSVKRQNMCEHPLITEFDHSKETKAKASFSFRTFVRIPMPICRHSKHEYRKKIFQDLLRRMSGRFNMIARKHLFKHNPPANANANALSYHVSSG